MARVNYEARIEDIEEFIRTHELPMTQREMAGLMMVADPDITAQQALLVMGAYSYITFKYPLLRNIRRTRNVDTIPHEWVLKKKGGEDGKI